MASLLFRLRGGFISSLSREIGGDDSGLARCHSMNKTRSKSGNFFDRFLFNKMDGESSMVPAELVSSGGCNDGDSGWMAASRELLASRDLTMEIAVYFWISKLTL